MSELITYATLTLAAALWLHFLCWLARDTTWGQR